MLWYASAGAPFPQPPRPTAVMTDVSASFLPPLFRDHGARLRPILRSVVSGWRLVPALAAAAALLALLILHGLPPEHTAAMVVGPIARTGASAMGARTPVAMRADMPLSVLEFGNGEETLSDFARFVELLTSPTVAARLMAEPGFLPHLFPERWDSAAGRWHPPGGLGGWLRRLVLALAGHDDWAEPDADLVSLHLKRMVVVQALGSTPMRRISVRDSDRAFAVRLLQRLSAAADARLREEAIRRAGAEIDYIRARLAVTQSGEAHAHASGRHLGEDPGHEIAFCEAIDTGETLLVGAGHPEHEAAPLVDVVERSKRKQPRKAEVTEVGIEPVLVRRPKPLEPLGVGRKAATEIDHHRESQLLGELR